MLGRSEKAVRQRAWYLRLRKSGDDQGWTAKEVAEGLGVSEPTVQDWLRRGLLRGARRRTLRGPQQGGDLWLVTATDLRQFCYEHPELIRLDKVEMAGGRYWFLDVLIGEDVMEKVRCTKCGKVWSAVLASGKPRKACGDASCRGGDLEPVKGIPLRTPEGESEVRNPERGSGLRTPETGGEFADWLEARGWDLWDAEQHLHIPWSRLRDATVWPRQRLPQDILEAIERCEG